MASTRSEAHREPRGSPRSSDRRGNPRKPTIAVFTLRWADGCVLGSGRDLSATGAYLVTSDDLEVQVRFSVGGREVERRARIVRVESVAPGSLGIALQFEAPLLDGELA